jgi:hypothetical protein
MLCQASISGSAAISHRQIDEARDAVRFGVQEGLLGWCTCEPLAKGIQRLGDLCQFPLIRSAEDVGIGTNERRQGCVFEREQAAGNAFILRL